MHNCRLLPPVLLLLAACASGTVIEVRGPVIEVRAGKYDRRETPLRVGLQPRSRFPRVPWKLVRVSDGRGVPAYTADVFFTGDVEIDWVLEEPLPAGACRRYRIEASSTSDAPVIDWQGDEGNAITCRHAGKNVLRYNVAPVPPPDGVDPVFARGGYLHPVWTPNGRVVTNDFPKNHLHHHGIWSAWTSTVFEGRAVDFWNLGDRKGRVKNASVVAASRSRPDFTARHQQVDLTAPDRPKDAIDESWTVRVYPVESVRLFDLDIFQSCWVSPLLLKKHHYGGIGFRGAASWEDKKDCAFLTSEGKTRADGNGTKARWCIVSGPVDGAPAWVAILCHPSSFRAPQPVRLHPEEPFFCYAPPAEGDFEIAPGKPYVARYRFVAGDRPPDPAEVERLWRDFAEPPEVVVR